MRRGRRRCSTRSRRRDGRRWRNCGLRRRCSRLRCRLRRRRSRRARHLPGAHRLLGRRIRDHLLKFGVADWRTRRLSRLRLLFIRLFRVLTKTGWRHEQRGSHCRDRPRKTSNSATCHGIPFSENRLGFSRGPMTRTKTPHLWRRFFLYDPTPLPRTRPGGKHAAATTAPPDVRLRANSTESASGRTHFIPAGGIKVACPAGSGNTIATDVKFCPCDHLRRPAPLRGGSQPLCPCRPGS